MLRRLSRLKQFRMLRRLDLSSVRGTRTLCQLDRLKKFRCVRTVSTPNFVLTRSTGEAAAKPPLASRSSGYVSNSRPRHREGSSSGNVRFPQLGSAEAALAAARCRVKHLLSEVHRLKFSRGPKEFMSQPNNPHKLTKTAEPYRGRESRLRLPLPPNRTCRSPASGSPVGGLSETG